MTIKEKSKIWKELKRITSKSNLPVGATWRTSLADMKIRTTTVKNIIVQQQRAIEAVARERRQRQVVIETERQRIGRLASAAQRRSRERIAREQAEEEEGINTQIIRVDKFGDFDRLRVESNATTLFGLYSAVKQTIDETGDIPFISIEFQPLQGGLPKHTTINSDYLDNFEDFRDRLAQITHGQVIGSNRITLNEYTPRFDKFVATFVNPLAAGAGGVEMFLCDVVKIKPSGENTCIMDSLSHFGIEDERFDKINTISEAVELHKAVEEQDTDLGGLLGMDMGRFPIMMSNKIQLTKKFAEIWMGRKDRPKFYDVETHISSKAKNGVRNKKVVKKVKLIKLRPDDYQLFDLKKIEYFEGDSKEICYQKDYKVLVYSRDEEHIAPAKRNQDGSIKNRDDLYITARKKEIYVFNPGKDVMTSLSDKNIFQQNGGSIPVDDRNVKIKLKNEIHLPTPKERLNRKALISKNKNKIKNTPKLALSYKDITTYVTKGYKVNRVLRGKKKLKKVEGIKRHNTEHRFLFVDYETVIDWSEKEIMIPVSLSVGDFGLKDLQDLEKLEQKNMSNFTKEQYKTFGELANKKELTDVESKALNYLKNLNKKNFSGDDLKDMTRLRKQAKTYIGYDCTDRLMEYIEKKCGQQDVIDHNKQRIARGEKPDQEPVGIQYTIVTFNGSYFDNILMLGDILNNPRYSDYVSGIFYTGNMLRNFKLYGRHEMFDLARHCIGSLKYNCESYKIDLFKKKEINFNQLQRYYDTGVMDKMIDCYKHGNLKSLEPEHEKFMRDLIEYNDYDVLSLAVLYEKYSKSIVNVVKDSIEKCASDIMTKRFPESLSGNNGKGRWSKENGGVDTAHYKSLLINVDLRDYKTIGSLAYGTLEHYWDKMLLLKYPKLFQKRPSKKFMDKYWSKKKIKAFFDKEKRLFRYYKDMQKYKTAGRVELFNGIQKYIGRSRSEDATSMYPYNMAVNKVYFPTGEITELASYEGRNPDSIGWFYCDIDQKYLRDKGLPNIVAEKKFITTFSDGIKKEGDTSVENLWRSKKSVKGYFLSTVKIDELIKFGAKIGVANSPEADSADLIIHNGIEFEGKIKGCELFKPMLTWMKVKNEQDCLKQAGSDKYNPALRQTVKLLLNCISGKVIERLHVEKTCELSSGLDFYNLKADKNVKDVNAINIIGNKIFCSYKVDEEKMIYKHRPVYWGILIYDYSQRHLYNYTMAVPYLTMSPTFSNTQKCGMNNGILEKYLILAEKMPQYKNEANLENKMIKTLEKKAIKAQKKYREGLFLCDTDANKMSTYSADICVDYMSSIKVEHWKEVEQYDSRYKNHKMYDPCSKVFGGYEDEFPSYNNVNYFLAKKHYASFFDPSRPHEKPCIKNGATEKDIEKYEKAMSKGDIKSLTFHFKGVSEKALVVENYISAVVSDSQKNGQKMRIADVAEMYRGRYRIKDMRSAYKYYNDKTVIENTRIGGKNAMKYFDQLSQGKTVNILCQSFRKEMKNLKKGVEPHQQNRLNTKFNTISINYTVKAISVKKKEEEISENSETLKENVYFTIFSNDE